MAEENKVEEITEVTTEKKEEKIKETPLNKEEVLEKKILLKHS